jgi:integrase
MKQAARIVDDTLVINGRLMPSRIRCARESMRHQRHQLEVAQATGKSTSMRARNLALRWRDVDFANRSVFVRQNRVRSRLAAPKSGKVRSVPLIDQAAAALDRLSRRGDFTEPTDLVFINDVGSYLDDRAVRVRFYGALKRAGLGHKRHEDPPLRFHDLRHTFGTLGAQVWPLRDVQAYMGHASITTTERYAHHISKANAADALTRFVATEADLPDGAAHLQHVGPEDLGARRGGIPAANH